MLTSCQLCGQVVEIMCLHEHMATECEKKDAYRRQNKANWANIANQCGLCHSVVAPLTEAGWKHHILRGKGCPKNARTDYLRSPR